MQNAWNDANFRNIIMREPISGVVYEPQYNITLSGVLKGSPVSIDTSKLKTATLSNRAFASSNLSVGDFCGRRFETSLFNFEGTYDGAVWESNVFELTYSVKKHDNSWVDISYGDFIVTEYSEIDGVIRLVLEDNRALFDVVFDTGFTVGETMFSALGKICAKAGVTLGSTLESFPNSSVAITNTAELVDMTCAQLVSFIAQACGRVAYIGKDNKLYLGWFSIPANAPKYESRAIGMGQTVALGSVSVTGMKWIKSDGTEILVGTNDYVITVANNPILVSNFSALLANASANLVGFEYTPTENKLLYFNPAMDILDVITVENRNGVEVELPIMDININGFGGMQANSYGEGAKAKAKNFQSVSSVIETVKKQALSAMLSLSNYETAVLNATTAINNNRGFYETKIVDETGKITEYYQHDKPLLSNSLIVTKITEGYVGKSTDGGQTYTTTISAYGATIPQLTTRLIFAEQITLGTETLPSVIEGLQEDVAGILTGSQNLLFNSTWGSFEVPESDFWEENITWQFLERRNASWNAIEASATNWNVFESGDW